MYKSHNFLHCMLLRKSTADALSHGLIGCSQSHSTCSSASLAVEFANHSKGPTLRDSEGDPPMSAEQCRHVRDWKRPGEISDHPVIFSDDFRADQLHQSIVTDCSLVASLAACLDHHSKFRSKVNIIITYFAQCCQRARKARDIMLTPPRCRRASNPQ